MELAPVLITVYDRLDCLQNAVQYLSRGGQQAKRTSLYIVSDGAHDTKHEGIIQKIRDYINSLNDKGLFKTVEGIFWDKNKGSFDSINDAMKYIFMRYDRLIVFEDDILVSNRFLEYMNNALEYYKDDERILSIASHTHYKNIAYKGYPHDVYISQMYSPWGVGIWRDRYESIDFEIRDIDIFLRDKRQVARFNAISRHMLGILEDMLQKGKKYGDVIICYNMFKKDKYTIYPIKPLSVNRGHDGRGEHCGSDKMWQNQALVDDFLPRLVKDIGIDSRINRNAYRAFFSYKRDVVERILRELKIYTPVRFVYKKIKNMFAGMFARIFMG